jgi:hypothetical protein
MRSMFASALGERWRASSMRATSTSGATGFTSKSSAPAFKHSINSSRLPRPVTNTT